MVSTAAIKSSSQNVTLPDIPELFDSNFLDALLPASEPKKATDTNSKPSTTGHPMIDALQSTAHQVLTDKGAPAYDSTLSPTLDAFQRVVEYTTDDYFKEYLDKAWEEDPALTLRIIWNIRSIHDGRGQKETFYRAFGWLYDNHPRTAISNLHLLVEPVCTSRKSKQALAHGYWKDLLNILSLATIDGLNTDGIKRLLHTPKNPYTYPQKLKEDGTPEEHIQASLKKSAEDKAAAQVKRVQKGTSRHSTLLTKLAQPKYRALYVAVARLFAERLGKDLHVLSALDALAPDAKRIHLLKQISLAGKWSPTPHGAHDRHTNIATAISLLLQHAQTPLRYPAALRTPLAGTEKAIILRSFYQRWILTPLRKVSEVPEPLMSAGRWAEIKYNRVSSICMKNNTESFLKHDPEGFEKYLISVEDGKNKISGATLLPHEIIEQVMTSQPSPHSKINRLPALLELKQKQADTKLRVAEAQWKTLIERLREAGRIDNALAVCDVSGSMGSVHGWSPPGVVQPIFPALALSLVLAHLAKPPFDGGFVTFSSRPEYVRLDLARPLRETVGRMETAEWEMTTDLGAVFLKLLLPLAVKHQVRKEDMIKRLFVFSDMQFDQCQGTCKDAAGWATNYDAIESAYKEAGYEVPQIVFWDLGAGGTVEVQGDRKGVALMNGFSPAMLKVFMGEAEEAEEGWEAVGKDGETGSLEKEEFTPVMVMRKALMKKSFDGLVVLD